MTKSEITAENLSVIIPTYNRRETLCRTLEALQNQIVSGFQVIVIDDGSTDDTLKAVDIWRDKRKGDLNFGLKTVRQKNLKQGQARNLGLKLAEREIVWFLGDDIIPDPACAKAHLIGHRRYNHNSDVAILGRIDWDHTRIHVTPFLKHINRYGAQFGFGLLQPGEEAPFNYFYTSNVSLHRSLLGQNPFDPHFKVYGWEDIELGYRLQSQGMRIIFWPEASAVHCHSMTMESFLQRQRQVGAAVHDLLTKHPEEIDFPFLSSSLRFFPYGMFDFVLTYLTPLLNVLDQRLSMPWPSVFYKVILRIALVSGWRKGRSFQKRERLNNHGETP